MPYAMSEHPTLQAGVVQAVHVNVSTYARLFVHNFSPKDMWVKVNKVSDPAPYGPGTVRIRPMSVQGWSATAFSGDVEVKVLCSVETECTVQAL